MTSILSTFDLAKQGDVNAIAIQIQQILKSRKIITKFAFDDGELKFYVNCEDFSGQTVGKAVCKYLDNCRFNVESIRVIKIYKVRENRWQLVYRFEPNNRGGLTPLDPNKNIQNDSDISPKSQPSEPHGELQQLKQFFHDEIQRLSQKSSQLEDALQKNSEENENLKARLLKLENLIGSTPPEPPQGGEQSDGLEIPKSTQLHQYLEQLNINVLSCCEPSSANRVMNQIAVRLGKHYTHLSNLHRSIVQSISRNQNFYFRLENSSQLEISHCTGFCQDLYDRSLLSYYFYDRNSQRITGKVDRKPDIINFLNGIWFEQFIYAEINELLVRHNIHYECLINPQLEFANGDKFELDFLFLIDGQVLWIECKSGRNNNLSYTRYENHKQVMKLSKDRSLLVLLQASKEQTEELTQMRDLTIANTDNLIEKVKRGLNWEIDA